MRARRNTRRAERGFEKPKTYEVQGVPFGRLGEDLWSALPLDSRPFYFGLLFQRGGESQRRVAFGNKMSV